ncbi:uncharacterized protein LOC127282412 isoform X2 [Leptopilina boulardi]|uniref:uncharacterized protein LOC127282412 isoform X2 n=1 Tax=Leptopilina boulardi TaxID=63433 RepID=UPI0021F66694|nr:uncharacterized protein LOC127282412 isoform X2 [Leptopilina boulardi]
MIMEEMEEDKYIEVDSKTIILHTDPPELPRLTPTGKISYAKTRVYTQRYRKEWEQTSDFKGWLTSVPHETTRAYCKYCKKDLHAHRLSLLKHMCTMKHQRAALMYQNLMPSKTKDLQEGDIDAEYSDNEENREEIEELEEGVEYTIETLESEEEIDFPEHKYARDVNEDNIKPLKMIKLEPNRKRDKLAEAMAHVHGEVSEENTEHIQLDMDVVSETVETSEFDDMTNEQLEEGHNLSFVSLNSEEVDSQINENDDDDNNEGLTEPIEFVDSNLLQSTSFKKINLPMSNAIKIKPNGNKTVLLSTSSRGVTLAPGKNASGTQYIFSNYKSKIIEDKKPNFVSITSKFKENTSQEASTSQVKKPVKITKNPMPIVKKPTISTHALDMTKGLPVGGLQVSLYKLLEGRWTFVNECNTSPVGRCNDLINSEKNALTTGRYKLHFDVDKYFSLKNIESLYPFIEIVFDVKNPVISYHIPVLLSPFGYTTYRGMDR